MNIEEWHEWRRQGLGASDAPVIMGVSPWSTPYQLWETKTGLAIQKESSGNFATERGNRLEPVARARYEFQKGVESPPKLAQHATYTWLRASLDGFDDVNKIVLEIKCPGADDHSTAVAGEIPKKYWPQVQHQLMVTGAQMLHYVSYDGEDSLAIVECVPDVAYMNELFAAEEKFWTLVTSKTPPELSSRDIMVIKDEIVLSDLANQYIESDELCKELTAKMKNIKELISIHSAVTSHPRCSIGRLNINRTVRKGGIDYEKVDELAGVDLEKYRKEVTSSLTFTIKKA